MTKTQGLRLTARFDDAFAYARKKHQDQEVKTNGTPYILHPMQVAGIALEHGADEEQAIAALLHDVLEDTPTTYEEIEAKFGERVAEIVRTCSDTEDHEEKGPWKERKQVYIDDLRKKPADAALVALADKVHNSRRMAADLRACATDAEREAFWGHFRAGRDGSLWYYAALVEVLDRDDLPAKLHQELRVAVEAMHELA